MRAHIATLALALTLFALLSLACKTTSAVTFVNPLDRPVYVTINERAPFEVAARGTVRVRLPSLERIQPLAIAARDGHGATVFAVTTSLARIEASGWRVELLATGRAYDPLQPPSPGVP